MQSGRYGFSSIMLLTGSTLAASAGADIVSLGEKLFFDTNLSVEQDQSCASCHMPSTGWTGPDRRINAHGAVYEGSVDGLFGNRKPPSSAYAATSPVLNLTEPVSGRQPEEVVFVGGNFWDGRATGWKLGNPAADQAQGPFLNPVEQALPDPACVVYRVLNSGYADEFSAVWGPVAIQWENDLQLCSDPEAMLSLSDELRAQVATAYDQIALSIAAYEASPKVNQYTSKYDYWLRGEARFTPLEELGLELFQGKALCADCHVLTPGPAGEPAQLTDFTYDNLGVPPNPDNPWYGMEAFNPDGEDWVDPGLGGFLQSLVLLTRLDPDWYKARDLAVPKNIAKLLRKLTTGQGFNEGLAEGLVQANLGKHKVPTLRNVDQRPYPGFVKAYMHNGVFKSLDQVVRFYNTRDVLPQCPEGFMGQIGHSCWPAPEVALNVNEDELGDLGLSRREERAIVAFMKTLTDGYEPASGPGQGQGRGNR